ncbi:dTMP kinase [Pelagibacterium montanilacus]|uniref:dTMP kinase n=1 Tax=Pelagibacterium montanilacus TaxID=2185280 RepID=UPI000F8D43EE|nr:dTMP kinase [Pelagibacterium montanilacus]
MQSSDNGSRERGRFITFEGGEGVGKSTQVRHLAARLGAFHISAVQTREPGGTPKAEALRSFILRGSPESWGVGAEAVLFAAARLDHVNELIAPSIAAGKWVICDRFADSTRAYQGLTGGVDERLIDALEVLALNGQRPDLTIILDMEPETSFARIRKRAQAKGEAADRYEREDFEFHRRLRDNFLSVAENEPERCVVLAADTDEEGLAEVIWTIVKARFPELAEAEQAV